MPKYKDSDGNEMGSERRSSSNYGTQRASNSLKRAA